MARAKATEGIDPNTVAFIPPEVLSIEQNRYVPQGEYRVINVVVHPHPIPGYPDIIEQQRGDLVQRVTIIDRKVEDPVVESEYYELYTGAPEDYRTSVEIDPNPEPEAA